MLTVSLTVKYTFFLTPSLQDLNGDQDRILDENEMEDNENEWGGK